MKYLGIFMYVLLIISYGYFTHMTIIDSTNTLWGYLCTLIFAILAIWSVNLYGKYSHKDEKKSEES